MISVDVSPDKKTLTASFKYDPVVVALIKAIPGRKYNPVDRNWIIPIWPESIAELSKLVTVPTDEARVILESGGAVQRVDPESLPEMEIVSLREPPLWKHQRLMVAWAKHHQAALWHCGMGTGKTRAAVDFIQTEQFKTVLVACPLSVVAAWKKQISLFSVYLDNIKAVCLDSGSVAKKMAEAEAALKLGAVTGGTVAIVINYESLWREPFGAWALKQKFDLFIMDEIQANKSPGGKSSRYCHKLSKTCGKILGLSGTPLPHSPMDAYGVFRALDDSIFGTSFQRFRMRYAVMGGFQNKQVVAYTNQDEMSAKINSIRIHVSRDVLDLPPAVHIEQVFELDTRTRKIYNELENELYVAVDAGEVTAANALTKLLRLQQITSGYLPLDVEGREDRKYEALHTGKADLLKTILDGLDQNEPVIVFCRFRHDLESVQAVCADMGRGCLELSGTRKQLAEWQAGDAPVIAVQVGAGSEGIDLTRAAYCVYYSLGFSLNQYEQSLARPHRPGQHRTVFFYHLIAEKTVDRKVYSALKERKAVIEAVLNRR